MTAGALTSAVLDGQSGPCVRLARLDDAAAIQQIYAHFVLNSLGSFEENPPDEAEIRRRMAEVQARGHPYIVALDEAGDVVGYTYVGPFRLRSSYRFTVEDSIYVAAGRERQGLGRLLLSSLIERCTAVGLRQMVAVIGDSGNRASRSLHAACGFVDAGRFPAIGYKHGRWVDIVMMQRSLGPGASRPPG